jgi:hypothetical protein
VTFGAYAKHRLRGAMLDHTKLNRNQAVAIGGTNEIDIVSRPKSPRRAVPIPSDDVRFRESSPPGVSPPTHAKGNDSSTLVRQYLENGGAVRHRFGKLCIPAGTVAAIEQLLPRLNHRQQAVYLGRVLTDPPLSRTELAQELALKTKIKSRARAGLSKPKAVSGSNHHMENLQALTGS